VTVRNYEAENTGSSLKTWREMKAELERAGVAFIDGGDGMGSGARGHSAAGAQPRIREGRRNHPAAAGK
jgi:hypothetical protein